MKVALILLPFFIVFLFAGLFMTSGSEKFWIVRPITAEGLALTMSGVFVTHFGFIVAFRIFAKKYRHTEIFLPAFDGISRNLICLLLSIALFSAVYCYIWLPHLTAEKMQNRIYRYGTPFFVIMLPGSGLDVVLSLLFNTVMMSTNIVIDESHCSIKIRSLYGKYRSIKIPLDTDAVIATKNFLFRTTENMNQSFPQSDAYGVILRYNGLKYLVYYGSKEMAETFASELKEHTGWSLVSEPQGFIDRDRFEIVAV